MDKCKNYTPLIHSCIGGKDNISFDLTSSIPVDLEKLKKECIVESAPLPLHNDYVLWYYALRITRENDDDFSLSLVSKGSHLGNAEKRGLANDLPCLTAPPIVHLKLLLLQKDQSPIELNLVPSNDDGFSVDRQFSLHELIPLTVSDGLHFSSSGHPSLLVLHRLPHQSHSSYTVSVGVQNTVEAILRGTKKPHGCDWEITKDPTAKRGLLKELNGSGVRIAVHIAYGTEVPLPERNDYAFHIIDRLHKLFGDHFTSVVIPQWERTICSKALSLNMLTHLGASLCEGENVGGILTALFKEINSLSAVEKSASE